MAPLKTAWTPARDLTQPPLLLRTLPKTIVPSSIAQLRAEPEIVKLAEYIFARAHEVLNRTKPMPYTQYVTDGHDHRLLSARQFEFDHHQRHHEIRQTGLVVPPDGQDRWYQTRVVSFGGNSRWTLSADQEADPRLLEFRKFPLGENDTPEFGLDDADRVMNGMRRALETWLEERDGNDFLAKSILPKIDRFNGFIQGFSHRVSPPKD